MAVGVLAPRRRRRKAVYRRRRITVLAVLGLVIVVPWCATRPEGGKEEASPTRPAARSAPAAASAEPCAAAIAELPLRARLALTLMVGVDGSSIDEVEAVLGAPARPGGLFVRGGAAVWDERVLVNPRGDGLPLLVAVDDEGGRVQPMEGVLDHLASAAQLAEESPEQLQAFAADRGADLRGLGINVVLGPVVDVGSGGGIGDRSFGDSADVVSSKAGAYAAGLRQAGILPVLKHFPGQGRADADTHDGPSTAPPLDILRTSDLVPFDHLLADQPTGVMVGHLDVPALTEEGVPASLSTGALGLLRSGYEFDGLVVTDDLAAMEAVRARFSVPHAAERALAAGADVLLLSQPVDMDAVLDQLEDAVNLGRIPDRRLESALARVAEVGCPG